MRAALAGAGIRAVMKLALKARGTWRGRPAAGRAPGRAPGRSAEEPGRPANAQIPSFVFAITARFESPLVAQLGGSLTGPHQVVNADQSLRLIGYKLDETEVAQVSDAPALAAALPARPADPGPGPPRVPEHPPDPALPGQRAETRQTRTRTPARIEEPSPRHPPRRGQNRQARQARQENPQAEGLNNKHRQRRFLFA